MKRNLIIIVSVLFLTAAAAAQDLVQWRGPDRSGIYPDTALLESWPEGGPVLVWHAGGLGQGHSSPVVAGDKIFLSGTLEKTGHIFCFSSAGKLLWKVPYGKEWIESWPGSRSTPLFMEGRLYMMSGFGNLFCMDAETGKIIWTVDLFTAYDGRNIVWGVTENLLADGNILYCTPGGKKNNVIALDRHNGKLVWSCAGNGEVSAYCSPQLIKLPKRNILVTHTSGSILGIDTKTGALLWSHPQPNKWAVHANTPFYQNGRLYCVSGYGQGGIQFKLAADGTAKQEIWRNTTIDNRMGGFIVLGDRIYGSGDSNQGWFCVDWNTGKETASEGFPGRGVVISADGMLYCYNDSGEFILARPTATGLEKAGSFRVPYGEDQHWAHPVIAGGKLYIRHGSALMVYDISK